MSHRWLNPTITAAAILVLSGCSNPFATSQDEYGRVGDAQSLHSAGALDLRADVVETPPPSEELPLELPPDPFAAVEQVEISLAQCRAWTLENNLDLKVALFNPDLAETMLSAEEARFEALFTLNAEVSEAEPGQAEVFRDQFVRPWDIEPGVEVPLRSGGTVRIGVPMSRRQSFAGVLDNDAYATDLDFSISQPLLRNAGRRTSTHFIRIASLGSQISQARTKLEVIRQIAAVDRGYWLLYDAQQRLIVRQEQYERAVAQLVEAEARFRGGVVPRIEVFRAEAGVARRIDSIIRAELLVKDTQRALKRIVNREGLEVESPTRLLLTSDPNPVRYNLDAAALIDASLQQRMEMLELELQLAQDLSTIDFADNQKLPLFTVDYTYRWHGTGSDFGRSVQHDGNQSGWGWRFGLNVAVPLGNEAAKSAYHHALLTRMQRLATRSAREQAIKEEVLNALDNIEATWQRIKAAELSVIYQGHNYHGERGEYKLGLRTSTEVLEAEDLLANSKIDEIAAIVDYQVAQIDLAFATGMLLGASGVSW
jgi:outer membrane protein TolC